MISAKRFAEINKKTIDRHDMFYWQTDRPVTTEEYIEIFASRHDNTDDPTITKAVEDALKHAGADYANTHISKVIGNTDYKTGSVNINRLIVLDDGRELVLRMHPAGLHNGYFDVEAAAMNAARQYVPTPRVVTVLHNAPSGGFDLVLMGKMPGHNMKQYVPEHPDEEAELVREMGRNMARIHQVHVEGYGFFDNDYAKQTGKLRGLHKTFRDHVLAALPSNLSLLVGAEYITSKQADKITNLLSTSQLTVCDSPRLLHNDIADWNVLVDNRKLTAVLDWDECFAGDPVADIACWSLFFPTERLKTFLEGYNEVTPPGSDFDDRLHIYRLRYLVSKVTLRHKRKGYNFPGLLEAGIQALKEESEYFGL
jgi:aminoglycoside phosphotransferase (APT) family kinase protein